jgi:TolB-like protein/tetratricopeptide (TPR) repeat protein/tRNA A-37 threonylcarbamoyl transferase component Bud32
LSQPFTRLQTALADRYLVEREIGRGGMATVYLARDVKHDRPVALKVLHPEVALTLGKERFLREIQLTARLQHPHILPIHDSGEANGRLWYSMPFVAGESLRERLVRDGTFPQDEALRIAREVALALDYAHRQGIVHRDVKPENILLSDEHPLVADFGIAKAFTGGEALTAAGIPIGTPTYMAPEQIEGEPNVDGRADIYALATVLFEMLVGEPPFTGKSPQAVMKRRLSRPAPSLSEVQPGMPPGIAALVDRGLASEPSERWATAAEFARAAAALGGGSAPQAIVTPVEAPAPSFRRAWQRASLAGAGVLAVAAAVHLLRAGAEAEPPSSPLIAVVPFTNLGDSADRYFADGVADDIRGKLASLPGVRVIASASAAGYTDSHKSPEQIGRELGADYLLVGKVRREPAAGGPRRVRISPELIQVSGGAPTTRWQRVFDTLVAHVPDVQTEIAEEIASALEVEYGADGSRLGRIARTREPIAYEAYLRGQEIIRQGASSPGDLERAIEHFERAVGLDSTFAAAWAQLGWAKGALYRNAPTKNPKLIEEVKADGERALRLGGAEPEARQVLAFYHLIKGERGAAVEETRRGLRADPSNARLVGYMAAFLELDGRWPEALEYRRRAVELDPAAAGHAAGLATNLLWMRRYPDARAAADRYIILGPANPEAYQLRAMASLGEGRLDDARAVIRGGESRMPRDELLAFVAAYWDLAWLLDDAQQSRVLELSPDLFYGDTTWLQLTRAAIHLGRGDSARGRAEAEAVLKALAAERGAGEDADQHSRLGLAYAALGRGDEAVHHAQRSLTLLPIAKDALTGTLLVYRLAAVQARVGRNAEAVATLRTLLTLPFYVSPAWLRLDPNFARLQSDPEFRRLAG